MRTIDADKLYPDCMTKNGTLAISQSQIANAPTVEYTFEEAFQKTVCEQRLYCPERPRGKWQEFINEKWGGTTIYCPYCKKEALEHSRYVVTRQVKSNYCPYCGAEMEVDNDKVDRCRCFERTV